MVYSAVWYVRILFLIRSAYVGIVVLIPPHSLTFAPFIEIHSRGRQPARVCGTCFGICSS